MKSLSQANAIIPNSECFDVEGPSGVYRISVCFPHQPQAGLSLMRSAERPAAVFMLDGNLMSGMATDLLRMMQFGGHVPPCVLVGVGYPEQDLDTFSARRTGDFTPTRWSSPWDQDISPEGGGAADMRRFLVEQLLPEIETRYETDPTSRTLAGLSYGGLFTVDTMACGDSDFTNFLALSPSLHWDNRIVLGRVEAYLKSKKDRANASLYVAVGAQEMTISPPSEPNMARLIGMVQNTCSLANLTAEYGSAVRARIEVLADEFHHTVMAQGFSRGIRFLIGDWSD